MLSAGISTNFLISFFTNTNLSLSPPFFFLNLIPLGSFHVFTVFPLPSSSSSSEEVMSAVSRLDWDLRRLVCRREEEEVRPETVDSASISERRRLLFDLEALEGGGGEGEVMESSEELELVSE